MWDIEERGFLPNNNPIAFLPVSDIKSLELIHTWENFSHVLPHYLKEGCVREELICDLRKASQSYYHGCIDNFGGPSTHERTFLLLSYFATAYINSPEGKKKSKLPKEIVIPFARVAHLVSRNPVLDYTSFILYNWKIKDPTAGFTTNNIEILHTFTDSLYERSILISLVEMESIGIELICNLSSPLIVAEKINKINRVLHKAKKDVSIEFLNYWGELFSDYKDLKYEQWRPDLLTFPCDVFLQTPLLALLYKYLDIHFQNDYLNRRNEELQTPHSHRIFIASVSGIRNKCVDQEYYREGYNCCLKELIALRNHLSFRSSDIERSVIATKELNGYYL